MTYTLSGGPNGGESADFPGDAIGDVVSIATPGRRAARYELREDPLHDPGAIEPAARFGIFIGYA
jgi:hypothetical protein